MSHTTNADQKRVKYWHHVSPIVPLPTFKLIPTATRQSGNPAVLTDPVNRMFESQIAPPASRQQAAQERESLGSWDNEGGAINADTSDSTS